MTEPWQHRRPGRRGFPAKVARAIIARDPSCQLALPGVCTGLSTIADHVTGWADATALGWTQEEIDDPANGAGVCSPCHDKKVQAEAARGRARRTSRSRRPTEPHPGLIQPEQRGDT